MRRVSGEGPADARIMIIGEAPGVTEEEKGKPFIGASGQLLTSMLQEAGIDRSQCYITNTVKVRPPGNELWRFFYSKDAAKLNKIDPVRGLHPTKQVLDALDELYVEINRVNPVVIIPMGNYALWALTNCTKTTNDDGWLVPTGLGTWRGSIIYDPTDLVHQLPRGVKVIPTYHPAAVLRMWEWRAITVHDLKRAKQESKFSGAAVPKYKFTIRPSVETVLSTINMLIAMAEEKGSLNLAVDIETRARHIACLGVAWTPLDAICIPFMCVERITGYYGHKEEAIIVWNLRRLLTHPKVRVIGQNFSYDEQYIAFRWGFLPHLTFDTMIAQHVIFPGTPKGLDYLGSLYCDFYTYWKDEGKEWDPSQSEDQLWIYNCKDAVTTLEVHNCQQQVLDYENLREQFEFLMNLSRRAVRTMLRGVLVDMALKSKLSFELIQQINEYENYFTAIIGDIKLAKKGAKPWFSSPRQQQKLFYEVMKIPVVLHKKTRRPTVDDDALDRIAKREPLLSPLIRKMKEYRSLGVFYNNFITVSLDSTNRIRCAYAVAGTETLRLSSSADVFGYGTNLQNIPKGSED